jgi:SAM-dependent methyltransferase
MTPTSHSTQWVAEEFGRRAATYDGSEMHIWQARRAAQLLDVQPGQRILDVATGTGLAARAAVELAEHTTVIGIDVSPRMLEVARKRSHARPDEPRSAFDWVIDYGFAEPVRTASNALREAIFDTYADLYSAARRGGNSYDTLFTRCWLPGM